MTAEGLAREVRIANRATYWPVAPIDLVVSAPIVARLVMGAGPIANLLQAVALGMYAGSALRDWRDRQAIERIDFRREFGADVDALAPVAPEVHRAEVQRLAALLNDHFTRSRMSRRETAAVVDHHLTHYIASITGQQVRTSVQVRGFTLARLAWPAAVGVCDILSGDIAIFKDTGPFEPHIIAHEFSHRKGYWKELHAQVLAYLALVTSGDPVLIQAARCERMFRSLRILSNHDGPSFHRGVERSGLRLELKDALLERVSGAAGADKRGLPYAMLRLYDRRMRLTGQNGISDYDVGFTSLLSTFEHRQARPLGP